MTYPFRLVPFRENDWEAGTLYALHYDDRALPEVEAFLRDPDVRAPAFKTQFDSITRRLKRIAVDEGPYPPYADTDQPPKLRLYRDEGGGLSALQGNARKKLKRTDPVLRLYCLRFDLGGLGPLYKHLAPPPDGYPGFPIVVLAGGAVKRDQRWQDDPLLTDHLRRLQFVRDTLITALDEGTLQISANGFELDGPLSYP